MLEPPFMEINQAVGLPRGIDPRPWQPSAPSSRDLVASGFVADELARSGVEATVAPLVR